jgi:WD40 repeat protein
MRQVGLIPAGCQQAFFGGVVATKHYICYASSIAVYFLDSETFRLEKIIAYNSRSLSCFAVHPNEDLLVVGSLDGLLTSWNVQKEEIVTKINIGSNHQSHVDWSYLEDRTAVVVINNPFLSINTWCLDSHELKPISNPSLVERLATCLRYS